MIGIVRPEIMVTLATAVTEAAFRALDWFYIVAVLALLLVALGLAFSKYGRLVLGAPGDKPEFSRQSWLAMLFSAGMGVGLVFWGVAEPLIHFAGAPGSDPNTLEAARRAFVITGFHWGLHAWAVYCIAALVIAYYGYRRRLPYLPGASIEHGFAGQRWVPTTAWTANLIAVLAVAFGVAGSIGMGVLQLHSGLHVVAGVPIDSPLVVVGILLALIVSYTASAATSIDKGIRILSNVNMILALSLMSFVLVTGPTATLLKAFVTGVGDYLTALPNLSFKLYPYSDDHSWQGSWTLTYFIWWIAWAPFVGVFIARISRGRTIREFVLGVLLVPTVFSLLWFTIFGGTGLDIELRGGGGIAELASSDAALALFALFDHLPMTMVLNVIAISLIFVFLVTSVDSAVFVLGMLTTGGSLNPPRRRKLAWGMIVGLLGAALALTGQIAVLRSVAIIGAIPFTFILLIQTGALLRTLLSDASPRNATAPEGDDD